jgi:hypothetical protein
MACIGTVWYIGLMTKDQVKELLDRVLAWPADDQEKVARFVREMEQRRAGDYITDEEWEIIEARVSLSMVVGGIPRIF